MYNPWFVQYIRKTSDTKTGNGKIIIQDCQRLGSFSSP